MMVTTCATATWVEMGGTGLRVLGREAAMMSARWTAR